MEDINEKVYEKAVKLLSVRLHTTGELDAKLRQRGFAHQDILQVLRKLEEQRFLDDIRFAEIFVDNLKRYKDFGYYGIKAKLLARKVAGDVTEKALDEYFTLEDEEAVARRLIKKLTARSGLTASESVARGDGWKKLARSLQSRGFRNEIIVKTLGR